MRPPRRQLPPLTQGLAVDVFLQREHLKSAGDREAAGQSARSKKLQGDSGDADAEQDFRLTLGKNPQRKNENSPGDSISTGGW